MTIDAQDALLLVGVASLVGGVAMWSVAAALVLFGLLCIVFAVLMEMRAGAILERNAEKKKRQAS